MRQENASLLSCSWSSGLAYAKSARLYLQQMNSLESKVTETENIQFTENGYFTVQRRDLFWSGNFTDQTIEQDLM